MQDVNAPAARPHTKAWSTLLWIPLLLPCGALLESTLPRFQGEIDLLSLLLLPCLCLLVFYGLVLLHEGGHVLTGLALGFRFVRLTVGPISVVRDVQGVRIERQPLRLDATGMAIVVPTGRQRLRLRLALMVMGGPVTSLLAGLVFAHAMLASAPATNASSGALLQLLVLRCGTLISVVLVLATALPVVHGTTGSDGEQLRCLLRGGAHARRRVALWILATLVHEGARFLDLPAERIEEATMLRDESLDGMRAYLIAYYWALDRGDAATALRYIRHAVAASKILPGPGRSQVTLELTYMMAWYSRQHEYARPLWERVDQTRCSKAALLRTSAAIDLLEEHPETAIESVQRALQFLSPIMRRGDARAEVEWLEALLERARGAVSIALPREA